MCKNRAGDNYDFLDNNVAIISLFFLIATAFSGVVMAFQYFTYRNPTDVMDK
jgi:hypothetical protein